MAELWMAATATGLATAVGAGTSLYNSSQANKTAEKNAKLAAEGRSAAGEFKLPPMPAFIPADIGKITSAIETQNKDQYAKSDADFAQRHAVTVEAEKIAEAHALADQKGNSTLMPQVQAELMKAGIGGALSAFGDTGANLAHGSAGEADVATNLGLGINAFQQQNRANAASSLAGIEALFPRRQIGASGSDVAGMMMGNTTGENAYNQANYASTVQQQQYNQRLAADQTNSQIAQNNSTAQANATNNAAMAGLIANSVNSLGSQAGNYYGRQSVKPTVLPNPATSGLAV